MARSTSTPQAWARRCAGGVGSGCSGSGSGGGIRALAGANCDRRAKGHGCGGRARAGWGAGAGGLRGTVRLAASVDGVPMGHDMHERMPDPVSRLQFPDNLEKGVAGAAVGRHENTVRASGSSPVMTQSFGDGVDVTNVSRYPPPDLASILLHKRIVFLGEELVNDVVELIAAEFFYLAGVDAKSPIQMYIASTGTTRADGEVVALETNGTMIYDVMNYVKPDVWTANVGVAAGQAAMLLAAGKKGKRYSFPNATTLLQQPRTPLTGQLQAIELDIRWKEMESQMLTYYEILSLHTGHSIEKLKHDLYYPLYMSPADAIEYGIIDNIFSDGGGTLDSEMVNRVIEEQKRVRKKKLQTVDYNAKYEKYKNLK